MVTAGGDIALVNSVLLLRTCMLLRPCYERAKKLPRKRKCIFNKNAKCRSSKTTTTNPVSQGKCALSEQVSVYPCKISDCSCWACAMTVSKLMCALCSITRTDATSHNHATRDVACNTKPRDWLGRTSPKWPIVCRVLRETL